MESRSVGGAKRIRIRNRNLPTKIKPGLYLSVFAKNRRERIENMISMNGCLYVSSIFGDTFSRSQEKAVF